MNNLFRQVKHIVYVYYAANNIIIGQAYDINKGARNDNEYV